MWSPPLCNAMSRLWGDAVQGGLRLQGIDVASPAAPGGRDTGADDALAADMRAAR